MEFYYISYWKSTDGETFRLGGVIAANPQAIGALFPEDPAEQTEWDKLTSRWNGDCEDADRETFLQELAERGNGINEEYDEVRMIEAPNLRLALAKAYKETRKRRGPVIQAYEEIPVDGVRLV